MPSEIDAILEADDDMLEGDDKEGVKGGREVEDVEGGRGEEEEEEEEDMESFIRIRSQGDGIFEQEDEEDEDEFYDFAIPEVEMRSPPAVATRRKRKQDISFIENETEVVELNDEEEPQEYHDHEPAYSLESELYQARKRDRLPLYLLNPDDYAHDTKKQMQIRRAIITYRHHQDKKEQIIRLTEENKKLREYIETLKSKAVELGRCGCLKNQTANLEVLDIVIPAVPPRMYVRGSRPVLAVPYNRCSLSPTSFSNSSADVVKSELEAGSRPLVSSFSAKPVPPLVSKPSFDASKPLINITSSRLANLSSKTMNTNNVVTPTLPKPPVSKVFANGISSASTMVRTISSKPMQMATANRFSITGTTASNSRAGFVPISMASSIKTEPGVSSSSFMALAQSKCSSTTTTTTATTPIPLSASVKTEASTPATAAPVSRIVFARKGTASNSNAVQTASQLIFGTKSIPPGSKILRPTTTSELNTTPMTASQLALTNRIPKATVINSVSTLNNPRLPNHTGQIFRTASGQVLKLVQPRKLPGTVGRPPLPRWQVIAPKSTLQSEIIKRQMARQKLEEMWKQFDDVTGGDDDEMAIIAAMNGTSTAPAAAQRNRKQTMSTNVIKSPEGEIELNKYQDIVFEEAD